MINKEYKINGTAPPSRKLGLEQPRRQETVQCHAYLHIRAMIINQDKETCMSSRLGMGRDVQLFQYVVC